VQFKCNNTHRQYGNYSDERAPSSNATTFLKMMMLLDASAILLLQTHSP
jgi:hypothetical protein